MLRPMTLPSRMFEGCEQRGGAVTFVVVRHRPGAAGFIGNPGWVRSSAWDLAHMGIRGSRSRILISWESPVVASYPGFEPVCMIGPVSDAASNSHPVAALSSAAPISRLVGQGLRRAGPFSS